MQAASAHRAMILFTLSISVLSGFGVEILLKKDVKNNILRVGYLDDKNLYSKKLEAKNINWISGVPSLPIVCLARIRYRQPLQRVKIKNEKGKIITYFAKPQFAPARGQSVVFYKNGVMLGGGVIEKISSLYF